MTDTRELSPPQDEDRRRFSALTAMRNHWDNPSWKPGREAYYWYLCLDSPKLRELAAYCQERLPHHFLDPIPPDGLHLTLPRVGWTNEISDDELDRVISVASSSCANLQPFSMAIGPVSGSAGSVRFSIDSWEPVVNLQEHLVQAVESIFGAQFDREFRPHVGIVYCNERVPAVPLIKAVASLRELPSVKLAMSTVDLVRLRREGRTYRWSIVQSVSLGESP